MKGKYKPKPAPKWFPTSIVWVKRANMWCRTTWIEGVQTIEWFHEKPVEKNIVIPLDISAEDALKQVKDTFDINE